ncbi:EamA/RhaT family transporter [Phaeobacter gallaeciensis]|uniref:EamA/RhaT family transporter n=2 Tax=Roseobacteraceae TaxID=2854170 RepID=A0A366WRW2_9RHOB|nr:MULTISPECIES: DMT family transporter [Roseobacteraceae]MBT3140811.1 DMT family transporter [Falsiruegeria litorea]MBT8170555.1 DMT family transporter [Falsiruegeria litorea]RBW52765.1 EamA/RhaT family transporter [Phaeobacter gallaeciensis]
MIEKRPVDASGAAALISIATLLAFNQVVIKVTGDGFAPVFQAGLRSLGAIVFVLIWIRFSGGKIQIPRSAIWAGLLTGLFFSLEFICLYLALDMTTVSRTSILFYSMPVWLALGAHVLLPGEKLNGIRIVGLALAMGGVILALLDRKGGHVSFTGDFLAVLGAVLWAGIALVVRMSDLSKTSAETQLMSQLVVSAPVLLLVAPLFGPLIRDPQPIHYAGLAFQSIAVVSFGFIAWFRLLAVYKASGVASFSFLSPVLAVLFGWALLGEHIGSQVWIALGLVAAGIVLINRK